MKKTLNLVLEESEIIELYQIIIDDDAIEALRFLKKHCKGKILELLEGGCKVILDTPGAGNPFNP